MMRAPVSLLATAFLCLAPAAQAASLKAPTLQSPDDEATVLAIPPLTWAPVKRAAKYDVQVAADSGFGSLVTRNTIETGNTAATLLKSVPDGTYHWRVRGVSAASKAGKWSATRKIVKAWSRRPDLLTPTGNLALSFPAQPIALNWSPIDGAYKYLVDVTTDPSLANSVLTTSGQGVETSGTIAALSNALAPGTYYWAVTPVDAQGHKGARSAVGAFVTNWKATTTGTVTDLNSDAHVYDPELSWQPVSGAVGYDVEVNYSSDFAVGSKVCCRDRSIGTTVSPTTLLANNTYYWRVRAVDVNGNSGQWMPGPEFRKVFDDVAPTVPGLRVRDNLADPATDFDAEAEGLDVQNPVIRWDPVPGASSYELQTTEHAVNGCDWTKRNVDSVTTNTAWTPRAAASVTQPGPAPPLWPLRKSEAFPFLDGKQYCVRVLAIAGIDEDGGTVASEFTQINGANQPAFRYRAHDDATVGAPAMTAEDYVTPTSGTVTPRTPLLAWKRIATAASYWVVVSRDQSFTNVKEVGFTTHPAYAMRTTLEDETTSYYWSVIPAGKANGSDVFTEVADNFARSFEKRSSPPDQVAPPDAGDVGAHPRFAWTAAEGAKKYRLQVAADPSFGDPVADITTAATSYTPVATYPVDTVLHWRVRAVDGGDVGLNWSSVRTFRRRLPVPTLAPGNPTAGATIPMFSWLPVQGASAYDLHVDQADGTRKDFTTKSTAFTPTAFFGTGVFGWQVRARFPGPSGDSTGPYTPLQAFTRTIATPRFAKATRSTSRVLVTWEPATMVKNYRVEIANNTAFKAPFDIAVVDGTSYAPDLSKTRYASGGTLYWRVAAIDEGGNVGGYSSGVITLTRKLVMTVSARLRRGKQGQVSVAITDAGRQTVKGVKLTLRGAGVNVGRSLSKSAYLLVKPRRKGTITVTATKKGYKRALARIRVR